MTEKVALVCGGGRGLGGAVAQELSARGYRLALMSPSENCEKLAAKLDGFALRGRSESSSDLEAFVDLGMRTYGRIDAVVTNPGHPPKGELLEIPDDDWILGAEMIVMSVLRLTRLVIPIMVRQGRGAIVNISSYTAFEPSLMLPVSSVFRASVGALTKLCADRYADTGVRINAILPGPIDSLEHDPGRLAALPMKRAGTVTEFAKTVAFLLSDDAGYINGQNIRIDGGATRHV